MRTEQQLLLTQHEWRARLFEGPQSLSWQPGREIAAQLLLYLDQPETCWQLTTRWLRELLDADRVDGGWGGYLSASGAVDYQAVAEHQRPHLGLPSAHGQRFSATSTALSSVWQSSGLHITPNVRHARHLDAAVSDTLLAMGTAAKLAVPLWDGTQPVGILCADWRHDCPRWSMAQCDALAGFGRTALGPLLGQLRGQAPVSRAQTAAAMERLTDAERQVARLIVQGLSYKEIAWQLQRSLSTVDHHLRSLRAKCGVQSTARLARWLREHEEVLEA